MHRLAMRRCFSISGIVAVVALVATSAQAQLPSTRIYSVFPQGAQVGSTVDVTVTNGVDLEELNQLVFSHPGIKATHKTGNTFAVTVDAAVPPGIYEARAHGLYGTSNPRTFVVDTLPEILEDNNNATMELAKPVEIGTVVNGKSDGGADVDFYKVTAKKGQRILVDCASLRIDSKLQGELSLYSSTGRRLVRTIAQSNRFDPLLDFTIPADGDYFVRVADFLYGGGADYGYRLKIHAGPHIDFVLPPAGVPGSKAQYTIVGRNLPGGQPAGKSADGRHLQKLNVEITLPNTPEILDADRTLFDREAGIDGASYVFKGANGTSNAVTIGYAPTAPAAEVEPNDDPATSQKITVPGELAGIFSKTADLDRFEFEAKAGQVLWVDVFAQQLGSRADPYLMIDQVTKKDDGTETLTRRATVDDTVVNALDANLFDTNHDDISYRFAVPADATYRITLRDRYFEARGSDDLYYHLAIREETQDFRLVVIPPAPLQNVAAGYQTWSLSLRRGDNLHVQVAAIRRHGFDGTIDVTATGLPTGISCKGASIGPGENNAWLVFTAAEDSKPVVQQSVQITGAARIEDLAKVKAVDDLDKQIVALVANVPKLADALQKTVDPKDKAAAARKVADDKATADAAIVKTATDAKTEADKVVADAQAAQKKADDAKAAADKAVTDITNAQKVTQAATDAAKKNLTDAQSAEKVAADAKTAADKAAADAQAAATQAQAALDAAKKAAEADKDNADLAKKATEAEAAKKAADDVLATATVAQTAAVKVFTDSQAATVAATTAAAAAEKANAAALVNVKTAADAKTAADQTSTAAAQATQKATVEQAKTVQTLAQATATFKQSEAAQKTAVAEDDKALAAFNAATKAKTDGDALVATKNSEVATARKARDAAAKNVTRDARTATIVWNGTAQQSAVSRLTRGLAVSVMDEAAPYQVTTDVHREVLNHNGQLLIPVKLTKRNGFDNKITLNVQNLPKNAQFQKQDIEKGQDTALLRLFMPNNVAEGSYTIFLQCQGQVSYSRNPERVDRAKTAQEEAVKALAVATETAKTSATAATAGAKGLTDAMNAQKATLTALTAAQKKVTDSQAAEKTAADAKAAADKAATDAKTAADAAQKALDEAKKAADADATNQDLAKKATDADAAKKAADTALTTAVAAQTAATKVLTDAQAATKAATDAAAVATKANEDALAAVKVATDAKTKADADKKTADDNLKAVTAAKTAADAEFTAATAAAKAANLNYFPPSTPIIVTVKKGAFTLAAAPAGGGALKRGAKLEVKVTVTRINGFTGPVTVNLGLPPAATGLTAAPVTIPADQNEATLVVNAGGDATEGAIQYAVVHGTADWDGPTSADQPVTITVAK
ncbi:MAG: PPC domain-containing protein [Planctomycetota bacterium]|nr:PPC domain-containing protein [Planctomycetota bacterium]